MTCVLGSHDLCIGFSWLVYWVLMTCVLGSHGLCIEFSWLVYWVLMA